MAAFETLFLSEEETSLRLDKWLKNHYPEYSRTYFQFLIEEGAVLVNGSIVKKKTTLSPGDEVEVCFLLTKEIDLKPEPIPLKVVFEDEHLLIVDKPVGMVVHPAPGHPSGTFVNAFLHHCKYLTVQADDIRPGIVHRLDKDTSGLLIAAKNAAAHRKLIEQFQGRSIEKTYLAICVGRPQETTIDAPIGRHPEKRKEMAINYDYGKEAITVLRPIKQGKELCLIELKPKTGRTHQLRVHMKHIGMPILGDPVYGSSSMNKKYEAPTQLLHAAALRFTHPITNEPLAFETAAPFEVDLYF
jgi:23S rRNA pseudouridine1911/1915/1917 synthase